MPFILCLLLSISGLYASETITQFGRDGKTYLEVPKGMGSYFVQMCTKYDIPLLIAYKLIYQESKWNPKAINKNSNGSKDIGIMQLNSTYLDEFAWRYNEGIPIDPFDWQTSMRVGLKHLATLYKHTGSWYGAVIAYNIGLTAYRRHEKGLKKLPSTTKVYVAYILNAR